MRPKLIHSGKRRNSSSQYLQERRKSQCQPLNDLESIDNSASQALLAAQLSRRRSIATENSLLNPPKTPSSRRASLFDAHSEAEMLWGPGPIERPRKKSDVIDFFIWFPNSSAFKKARWLVVGIGLACLLYALGAGYLKGISWITSLKNIYSNITKTFCRRSAEPQLWKQSNRLDNALNWFTTISFPVFVNKSKKTTSISFSIVMTFYFLTSWKKYLWKSPGIRASISKDWK